jgi:hypothetical protein
MGSIKHNKYKNTGILFELCVRQITTDLLNNRDSKAIKIFKRHFINTELGNEYALYSAVANSKKLNETKSEVLLSTVLEQHKKLDFEKISRAKYNLIKEIKQSYDIEDFLKAKIDNYKVYAALYTLFESQNQGGVKNTKQIVENKVLVLEHLTEKTPSSKIENVVSDLMKEDKEIRLIAHKMFVKRFNSKYSFLDDKQKQVLKEYIYNATDTVKLKDFLNGELAYIKKELTDIASKTKDKVVKIKINEVLKFVAPIRKNENVKDELITGILQYHELINELKSK